jgi:glycosyltransferase involved in cell wall biosynthesis
MTMPGPEISVVIPTHNRSALLRTSLASLAAQSLARDRFEVVVVDDGSPDDTAAVCEEAAARLNLRYFRINNSGISAAKNLGLFAAAAPLLLFFDDDDVAAPDLLRRHLQAHAECPDPAVAVLGYTCWMPGSVVTPVMEYVTDIGQLLFAYRSVRHGQRLDHTYFWGGRSSCKRAFLAQFGVFNPNFRSIIEDVELGYRLSRHGLSVVYRRDAVSYMARPITFDAFCRRCERQGGALYLFSRLHEDPVVRDYCRIEEALARWPEEGVRLPELVADVIQVEARAAAEPGQPAVLRRLQDLYRASFEAFRHKGIAEAAGQS